jgi:hypothetical protein
VVTEAGSAPNAVRAIHPYPGIGSLPAVNHQREFADAAVAWTALDLADR